MVDFFYPSTRRALSKKFNREASMKIRYFLIFYMGIFLFKPIRLLI